MGGTGGGNWEGGEGESHATHPLMSPLKGGTVVILVTQCLACAYASFRYAEQASGVLSQSFISQIYVCIYLKEN